MASYKIFVTRRIRDHYRRQLADAGTVNIWDAERPIPRGVLLRGVSDADALLCMGDDSIDRAVIAAARRLRVISTVSAGYDHIDLDAAVERGIVVCHTPGAANEAVADLTLALLLACARRIREADLTVRQGEWQYWYPDLLIGTDVQGSTIGIVGLGTIGIQVAHRALGFGMRVLYHDVRRNIDAEELLGVQYGELDDLLREADFVTLHVPLTPTTVHLIDARRLRLMKPTAFLINTAHGEVVDYDSLVRALREGWIAGAGLDVFSTEPLPSNDPLIELSNVILSPHIGANTRDAQDAMFRMAVEQLIQVLEGRTPAHAVPLIRHGREAA